VGFVVFTFYGGLLPFHYSAMPLADAVSAFRNATVWDTSDLGVRGDWVVSIVQFAVLGYLLMAALCCDRQRAVGFVAAAVIIPFCVCIAFAIEFLQVYFPPRTVSVNDLVVESAGGIAGTVAWLAVGPSITAWCRRLGGATSLAGLAGRLLPAYVTALVVVQLMPFDFVFTRDELAAKAAEGRIQFVPFGGIVGGAAIGKAALIVLAFVPLGLLAACGQCQSRHADDNSVGLGTVVLVPPLVSVAKIFVYSRSSDTSDVLIGVAGVVVGWTLGSRLNARTLARWTKVPRLGVVRPALFLVWFVVILYCNWRPFDFTSDPSAFAGDPQDELAVGLRHVSLAPFVDYYQGSKYNALDRFAFKALSFVPLGVLLALSSGPVYRPRASLSAVTVAIATATVVEVGRYFLPNRVPSTTDILIQSAGAWTGFWLTRTVRAILWAEGTLYGWLDAPSQPLLFITSETAEAPLRPKRPGTLQ
jgi:VanZ family protein